MRDGDARDVKRGNQIPFAIVVRDDHVELAADGDVLAGRDGDVAAIAGVNREWQKRNVGYQFAHALDHAGMLSEQELARKMGPRAPDHRCPRRIFYDILPEPRLAHFAPGAELALEYAVERAEDRDR